MSTEDEVRKASKSFYAALNRLAQGDAGPMKEIWSHGKDVTAMHPIGGRLVGWDEVWRSWEGVANAASGGTVEQGDQHIGIAGDLAYELGTEWVTMTLAGQSIRGQMRVTNIYRREGGTWKMIHHHTDIEPGMKGVWERMQAGK